MQSDLESDASRERKKVGCAKSVKMFDLILWDGTSPFLLSSSIPFAKSEKVFSKAETFSLCLSVCLSVSLSLFVCLYLFLSHSFPKSMCGIAKCVCMGEWTGEDDRDRDEGVLVIEHIPIDLVCVVRLP